MVLALPGAFQTASIIMFLIGTAAQCCDFFCTAKCVNSMVCVGLLAYAAVDTTTPQSVQLSPSEHQSLFLAESSLVTLLAGVTVVEKVL